MKKEQWQAVYTPNNEEMLEWRVRQTLSGLQEDAPARRISGRRMMLIAAALVLMLAAAVAAAAGWMRSAKYDAKLLAQQALYDKYGFTREMDSFFICTVEENDGETVVTYHANEDVGDYAWKLGDYIVTIRNGQAEASWSNDGEAVGDDFSSDVWDTALLAKGIERRKAGEEWYEITGTELKKNDTEKTTADMPKQQEQSLAGEQAESDDNVLPPEGMMTEEEAIALARQALVEDGGLTLEALDDEESEMYATCTLENGKYVWSVWHHSAMGISVVEISAEDGTIMDVIVDSGMAGNG